MTTTKETPDVANIEALKLRNLQLYNELTENENVLADALLLLTRSIDYLKDTIKKEVREFLKSNLLVVLMLDLGKIPLDWGILFFNKTYHNDFTLSSPD